MIPAGYMAKFVVDRPDWLGVAVVEDIYSVSGCVSPSFADYYSAWKHNGFWLFNSTDVIRQLASEKGIDLTDAKFFYYELHERQFGEDGNEEAFEAPDPAFATNVSVPQTKSLEGFDVVTFWAGAAPECSPLSCNGLAREHDVNRHCLLASLEEAISLLKTGAFKNCEPGPFRIFSVYSL
jgi:hypothetical protein